MEDAAEKLNSVQRLCVLMFDEMALSQMHLNISSDHIIGFKDLGEKETTENIADHVLVPMIKEVKANYKQPIFMASVEELQWM